MLTSGLPELKSADNIRFMKGRFHLDLSDAEAAELFARKIQENRGPILLDLLSMTTHTDTP